MFVSIFSKCINKFQLKSNFFLVENTLHPLENFCKIKNSVDAHGQVTVVVEKKSAVDFLCYQHKYLLSLYLKRNQKLTFKLSTIDRCC